MDALIILSIIAFWFCIILFLKHYWSFLRLKRAVIDHVSDITDIDPFEKRIRRRSRKAELFQKITKYADEFSELGQRINFFSENHSVNEWLRKAGNPLKLTVERFQGLKILLFLVGLFGGILTIIIGFPFSQYILTLAPVFGYFLPIILIRIEAKKRQEQLRRDLPDFLDTVGTSVQAGVSLDHALKEVIRHFDGPIREEFSRFNQEIELGVPREKAYRELLKRNDNPEFQSLIKALIQGLNLGVPIARTFQIQSEDMRQIQQEKVKEMASKASPKVTLVTTFLIAPVSILIIAGLMIMNMIIGENGISNMF